MTAWKIMLVRALCFSVNIHLIWKLHQFYSFFTPYVNMKDKGDGKLFLYCTCTYAQYILHVHVYNTIFACITLIRT
jgi:hypothetical protein